MQNLDPKEQFFGELGLVWFGFVCGDLGLTKSLCCLATTLIKLSLLLSVRCGLWVVGCWLELRGWFCFLFCCFFIWLPTVLEKNKKNARRWWVRERREEEEEEEEEKERKKECKKTKEDNE